ncbi:glycosyl transferase [Diplonema papillatum]|nr:glycosyl transferase [Diplonema papillatum]
MDAGHRRRPKAARPSRLPFALVAAAVAIVLILVASLSVHAALPHPGRPQGLHPPAGGRAADLFARAPAPNATRPAAGKPAAASDTAAAAGDDRALKQQARADLRRYLRGHLVARDKPANNTTAPAPDAPVAGVKEVPLAALLDPSRYAAAPPPPEAVWQAAAAGCPALSLPAGGPAAAATVVFPAFNPDDGSVGDQWRASAGALLSRACGGGVRFRVGLYALPGAASALRVAGLAPVLAGAVGDYFSVFELHRETPANTASVLLHAAAWLGGGAAAAADVLVVAGGGLALAGDGALGDLVARVVGGAPVVAPSIVSGEGVVLAHGVDASEGAAEVVFYENLSGYSASDARAMRETRTPFVHPAFFAVSLSFLRDPAHIRALHGYSFHPPPAADRTRHPLSIAGSAATAAVFHLCLVLTQSERSPVVIPARVVFDDASRQWDGVDPPSLSMRGLPEAFGKAWAAAVYADFVARRWAPGGGTRGVAAVKVVWDTFCVKCFGFTNEVMHYIVALEKLAGVHSRQGTECFCPGVPRSFSAGIARMHQHKEWFHRFRSKAEWQASGDVAVWVSHKDPGSFSTRYSPLARRPDYVVGRSMYEFTKLDPKWIPNANDDNLVDEIWVPSSFVWAVFKLNGVRESKLVVIPEPIDTYFYDPRVTPRLAMPPRHLDWSCASNMPASDPASSELHRHYKFLSVFKLEERKGWDVLIDALAREFTRRDPVSLYLVCYIYGDQYPRDARRVLSKLLDHAKEKGFAAGELPHIEVITEELSEKSLVELYRSVDAFVLPTRGEGWGLPIIQAMSMGLPAIATNWSGNTDFMKPDASLLLEVESLAPVPYSSPYGGAQGKVWANPSEPHLRKLMRGLVDDPATGREIGRRGREFIVENYSDEVVARLVENRLRTIRETVLKKRRGG